VKKKKSIKTTPPLIEVLTRESVPKNSVAALARELRKVGNVRVRNWNPAPQAALGDWTLPALVFMYVTRPLFEGFLQELGATGARTLKTKLGKFIQRLTKRENRWITTSKTERLGPSFSIEFELEGTSGIKCSINCVFSHALSDDDVVAALSHLPRDVTKAGQDVQAKLPPFGHGVVGQTYVYDRETQRWQPARYLP
jgi:hypothetical protein